MSTRKLSSGMAVVAGLILLVGGCTAVSTSSTISQSPSTSYQCDAADSSWECTTKSNSDDVVTTSEDSLDSYPIAASQASQVSETEVSETPKRRPFWGLRIRGRDYYDTTRYDDVDSTSSTPGSTRTAYSDPTVVPNANAPAAEVRNAAISESTSDLVSIDNSPAQANATRDDPTTTPGSDTQEEITTDPSPSIDGLGGDYDYAVQLGAFTDYGRSSKFINSLPALDLMRFKTASRGKTYYIVIAGTFENKRLASAQSDMLATTYGLGNPYIRTVKSIRSSQVN